MSNTNLERGELSVETLKHFIHGGTGILTLTNTRTQKHVTIKFDVPEKRGEKRDPKSPIFVNLFTGSRDDDVRSKKAYSYFGCIWRKNRDGTSCTPRFWFDARKAKGGIKREDGCVGSISWLMRIASGQASLPSYMELWHEGICCFCNLPLTQTESIKRGYGPKCAKNHGLAYGKVTKRTKKSETIREAVDSVPDSALQAKRKRENKVLREAAAERREALRRKAEGKVEEPKPQSACADSLDGFKWVGR